MLTSFVSLLVWNAIQQIAEKHLLHRLLKNGQMQGTFQVQGTRHKVQGKNDKKALKRQP
jgi:hypothetical protein